DSEMGGGPKIKQDFGETRFFGDFRWGAKKSNNCTGITGNADIDNHGALTICLHTGGNPASVKTGLGLRGGGCSFDSLNQKSSSLPQPSLGSGGAGGLHSALSAGQAIWT